jgi:hypothetical protein
MKTMLIAVATGLLFTACGAVSTCACSLAVPPTSSAAPGLGFDVVVTEKDRVTTLRAGQKLEVALHAGNGMNNWMQVRSSNESILAPTVNPAATAVRGVTLAAFNAMAPGEAEITAYSSPSCSPGQACPMYVQVWSVRVTVTA